MELSKRTPPSDQWRAARDGTVVRALVSHQYDLGSNFGVDAICGPGGGGLSTQKLFIRGGSPELQPLTLLYTIFHEKDTPFVYRLLLTNGTPFSYLV